jgi:diguanylate cyclase (GGDEF)-like protein/putative nucleotidyltransferase with HDIG domain
VGSAPEDALRWARRLAAARDADGVLAALAEAVHDVLGMTVAVNLRRPADDRFEVTLVLGGGQEAADLVGEEYEAETFLVVCDPAHQRPDGLYLVPADSPYWQAFEGRLVVEQETVLDVPDAWRPGDMLDIALRDRRGEIMAVVAADDPADGRIPAPEKFGLVAVLATHAASALEAALASSDAGDSQREAEELQHLSLSLAAGLDEAEILTRASEGLAGSCGWAFVAVGLFDHQTGLVRCVAGAGEGRRLLGRTMPLKLAQDAMITRHRLADSYLLPLGSIDEITALNLHRSTHNGSGARGWRRHTLLLPLATGAGEMLGFVWVDDPLDRLLPSVEAVRRMELFVRQAALLVQSARLLADAREQATRDPLTGLENGRAFEAALAATEGTCSLALLDVDRFKLVNDRSGHLRGDALLRALGNELTKRLPRAARAFRLGGDEFAVLSATMTPGGLARSLAAVRRGVDGVIDFSAGIAAAPIDAQVGAPLIHAADEALRSAKRAGRGRTERYRARTTAVTTPADLSRALGRVARRDGASGEVLDALLDGLTSTLEAASGGYYAYDLGRDVMTLRHVRDRSRTSVRAAGDERRLSAHPARRALVERNEPLLVRAGERDADPIELEYLDAAGCAALALVPVTVESAVIGHIELLFTHDAPLAYADLSHALSVADIAGLALARERDAAEVERAYRDTVAALATALEAKDADTGDHARALAALAGAVARRLSLDPDQVRKVEYAALFHDIGKIATPTEILLKPGPLTPDERTEIEQHVVHGARIVERIGFLRDVAPAVRHSHERWDGNGYPSGLAGREIPLAARIVFACDTWHAMTSDRVYRKALSEEVAAAELRRVAGSQLDPVVVEALLVELGVARDLAA